MATRTRLLTEAEFLLSDELAGAPGHPAARRVPDRSRAVAAVRELLAAVGDDPDRPTLRKTPERVADLFLEFFAHLGDEPDGFLGTPMSVTEDEPAGELAGLTGIRFRSLCEHHLLPFEGTVDIHYAPHRHLAGLSRLAALVRCIAHRPQLQERMGEDIADAVERVLRPHGVAVRIRATHGCVAQLEPSAAAAVAVTSATRGTMPPWGALHEV